MENIWILPALLWKTPQQFRTHLTPSAPQKSDSTKTTNCFTGRRVVGCPMENSWLSPEFLDFTVSSSPENLHKILPAKFQKRGSYKTFHWVSRHRGSTIFTPPYKHLPSTPSTPSSQSPATYPAYTAASHQQHIQHTQQHTQSVAVITQ